MAPKPKIVSKKHIARLERERRQVTIIKYIAIFVVVAVALIVGYGFFNLEYLQPRQPVAEVNGEKIPLKEFEARVVVQRNQLLNQYMQYMQYQQMFGLDVNAQLQQIQSSLDVPTIVGQQVLDAMINEALIRQEAAKRDISVSSEELEAFKQEQFGYFPNGTPTPTITPTPVDVTYPTLSPEQLKLVTATPEVTPEPTSTPVPTATPDLSVTPTITPVPSATATPYTLEGYQKEFEDAQKSMLDTGLTKAEYNRLFETEILRTKLLDEVTKDVPHEEEQVWARHILLSDEAIAMATLDRLKKGEDFAKLATELSQDTGSGANGGDLGWFGKGAMVPEFEAAAFALKVGEISEPVQSNFGWHIIQLLGRTTVPMTASQYEQARQTAFNDFLTKLRDESDVVTYDELWQANVPTSPSLQDLQQPQQ